MPKKRVRKSIESYGQKLGRHDETRFNVHKHEDSDFEKSNGESLWKLLLLNEIKVFSFPKISPSRNNLFNTSCYFLPLKKKTSKVILIKLNSNNSSILKNLERYFRLGPKGTSSKSSLTTSIKLPFLLTSRPSRELINTFLAIKNIRPNVENFLIDCHKINKDTMQNEEQRKNTHINKMFKKLVNNNEKNEKTKNIKSVKNKYFRKVKNFMKSFKSSSVNGNIKNSSNQIFDKTIRFVKAKYNEKDNRKIICKSRQKRHFINKNHQIELKVAINKDSNDNVTLPQNRKRPTQINSSEWEDLSQKMQKLEKILGKIFVEFGFKKEKFLKRKFPTVEKLKNCNNSVTRRFSKSNFLIGTSRNFSSFVKIFLHSIDTKINEFFMNNLFSENRKQNVNSNHNFNISNCNFENINESFTNKNLFIKIPPSVFLFNSSSYKKNITTDFNTTTMSTAVKTTLLSDSTPSFRNKQKYDKNLKKVQPPQPVSGLVTPSNAASSLFGLRFATLQSNMSSALGDWPTVKETKFNGYNNISYLVPNQNSSPNKRDSKPKSKKAQKPYSVIKSTIRKIFKRSQDNNAVESFLHSHKSKEHTTLESDNNTDNTKEGQPFKEVCLRGHKQQRHIRFCLF